MPNTKQNPADLAFAPLLWREMALAAASPFAGTNNLGGQEAPGQADAADREIPPGAWARRLPAEIIIERLLAHISPEIVNNPGLQKSLSITPPQAQPLQRALAALLSETQKPPTTEPPADEQVDGLQETPAADAPAPESPAIEAPVDQIALTIVSDETIVTTASQPQHFVDVQVESEPPAPIAATFTQPQSFVSAQDETSTATIPAGSDSHLADRQSLKPTAGPPPVRAQGVPAPQRDYGPAATDIAPPLQTDIATANPSVRESAAPGAPFVAAADENHSAAAFAAVGPETPATKTGATSGAPAAGRQAPMAYTVAPPLREAAAFAAVNLADTAPSSSSQPNPPTEANIAAPVPDEAALKDRAANRRESQAPSKILAPQSGRSDNTAPTPPAPASAEIIDRQTAAFVRPAATTARPAPASAANNDPPAHSPATPQSPRPSVDTQQASSFTAARPAPPETKSVQIPAEAGPAAHPSASPAPIEATTTGAAQALPRETDIPADLTGRPSPVSADNSPAPAASSTDAPPSRAAEIIDQIAHHASLQFRAGQKSISIQLDPPELGRVQIHVSSDKGVIATHLEVGSPAVKELLETNLGQLRAALEKTHLDIGSCSVSIGAEGNGGDPKTRDFRALSQTARRSRTEPIETAAHPASARRPRVTGNSSLDYFA